MLLLRRRVRFAANFFKAVCVHLKRSLLQLVAMELVRLLLLLWWLGIRYNWFKGGCFLFTIICAYMPIFDDVLFRISKGLLGHNLVCIGLLLLRELCITSAGVLAKQCLTWRWLLVDLLLAIHGSLYGGCTWSHDYVYICILLIIIDRFMHGL